MEVTEQLTLGSLFADNQPNAADCLDMLTDEYKPYSGRALCACAGAKQPSESDLFDALMGLAGC